MKKILLSLTALLFMCGASYADIVYMTQTGSLGTIKTDSSTSGDNAPSMQYSANMSSPFITSFWDGDSTSIMLLDRNAGDFDRAYIFDPNSMTDYYYSADVINLNGAENAGYAENGESIFFTSGSKVYNVDTTLLAVLESFDCTRVISADGYRTHVDNIAVGTQVIHVIASAGNRKRYIRFDGQLKGGVNLFMSADIAPGASAIMSMSSNYAVIGHDYGIDTQDRNGKFYRLISTDYPVVAMCPDSSNGFFYATQYYDGEKYIDTVYHSVARTAFDPFTTESASPNIKMIRDSSAGTFAVMTDESIALFTYKDNVTTVREYFVSALGGVPAGIAAATVSGYNWSSGSGGCNTSGLGALLAGLAVLLLRRK